MKRVVSFLLALLFCVGISFSAFAQTPSDGLIKSVEQISAVPEGFTAITTAEELNAVRNNLDGKYILMNDIDLSNYSDWESIGTGKTPFKGVFNGNCYKISNLRQKSDYEESKSYLGLFGAIENAIIADLILTNVEIKINVPFSATYYVGSVAAFCISSKILNCSAEGSIEATAGGDTYIGGIIGAVPGERYSVENDTVIANCKNSINILFTGKDNGIFDIEKVDFTFIGGIVGELGGFSPLIQCVNYGNISAYTINAARVGGIVGCSFSATVKNCANHAGLSVNHFDGSCFAGGVCGYSSSIEFCVNSGRIISDNEESNIGEISGAVSSYQTVSDCYYLSGSYYSVGSSDNTVSISANPLSDSEMKSKNSFSKLDFENIWFMAENSYPIIKSYVEIIPNSVNLYVGRTSRISSKPIYVCLNDSNVVLVDSEGFITGISSGNAKIELFSEDGQFVTINVGVKNPLWNRIVLFFMKLYSWLFGFHLNII